MQRRRFIQLTAGATIVMPVLARAEAHGGDTFDTPAGPVTVHPVQHASFVMETPAGMIYVDPVGGAEAYADLPPPDLILVTHEHGDHYDEQTLAGIGQNAVPIIVNPAVRDMLPEPLAATATAIANGESTEALGLTIDAIPAHNLTEDRLNFHPPGRDNGYVVNLEGFRVYVSGDTEDVPEMRALEDIDLAFVCMNLPFTMDAETAADAVRAFAPGAVYPYHYRGRDGGTQDPEAFAEMVGDASEVLMGNWYPEGLG